MTSPGGLGLFVVVAVERDVSKGPLNIQNTDVIRCVPKNVRQFPIWRPSVEAIGSSQCSFCYRTSEFSVKYVSFKVGLKDSINVSICSW